MWARMGGEGKEKTRGATEPCSAKLPYSPCEERVAERTKENFPKKHGRAELELRAPRFCYFLNMATKPPPEFRSTESVSLAESLTCSTLRAAGLSMSRRSVAL